MSNHQDMSRKQGRTQTSAETRRGQLNAQGHEVQIDGGLDFAVVTITRREGFAHHIIYTPELLPPNARDGAAFKTHPQTVMIAYALHAIADWSAEIDRRTLQPCLGCGRNDNTKANFNQQTGEYDWFCPTCFYGAYEESAA